MASGSQAIIIVTAVFLALSLFAVCLRCFVRLYVVKSFGRDDGLMVAAAVGNLLDFFRSCSDKFRFPTSSLLRLVFSVLYTAWARRRVICCSIQTMSVSAYW
jgi:hypothetical protein